MHCNQLASVRRRIFEFFLSGNSFCVRDKDWRRRSLVSSILCRKQEGGLLVFRLPLFWLAVVSLLWVSSGHIWAQTPLAKKIACGSDHSLVVSADGTVWSSGNNLYGQLGNNDPGVNSATPIQVSGLDAVVAVACGYYHSMALKVDGTVWCWGEGYAGQLGNDGFDAQGSPVQVTGLDNVIAIGGGEAHSMALKSDGTVWVWGANSYGQLGNSVTSGSGVPVQVAGLTNVVGIACGANHNLALKEDGSVWAWGSNTHGQLGTRTIADQNSTPAMIQGFPFTTQVACGHAHSLAVLSDGSMMGWGQNSGGGVGSGSLYPRRIPAQIPGLTKIVGATGGGDFSVAVDSDGAVWGLGVCFDENYAVAVTRRLSDVSNAVDVACGQQHYLVLKDSGATKGGGNPLWEQLGRSYFKAFPPVPVSGINSVVGIKCGESHSLVLKSDGTAWAWGNNLAGQLGNGSTNSSTVALKVEGLDGIVAISGGASHNLAIKGDGTIWAWGSNLEWQLANNTLTRSENPVQIPGLSGVIATCGGSFHSLVLKEDGTVWGWGGNSQGELGNNSFTPSFMPVQASGLTDVVRVAAGDNHNLARKSDGTVWAWGSNSKGQLGNNSVTSSNVPVQVYGLAGVALVDCGAEHSVALKSDGTVWVWGSNGLGQLGSEGSADSPIPVQVAGLSGVVGVACGDHYTFAWKSDGTVWAWGANSLWQLGDEIQGNANRLPREIEALRGASSIDGGRLHSIALKEDGKLFTFGAPSHGELEEGILAPVSSFISPLVDAFEGINALYSPLPVVISDPGESTVLPLGQAQTVRATFDPGVETAVGVKFFHRGIVLATDNSVPFEFAFAPSTWGKYEITATGVDSAGKESAKSSPVIIEVPFDHDGDALPDWWEIERFGNLNHGPADDDDGDLLSAQYEYQHGSDPNNYYSQGGNLIVPTVEKVGGDSQSVAPGQQATAPLVVRVTNSATLAVLQNAPVTYTMLGGGGKLSTSHGGTSGWADSVVVRSAVDGLASAHFMRPVSSSQVCQLSAQSGTAPVVDFQVLVPPFYAVPSPVEATLSAGKSLVTPLTLHNQSAGAVGYEIQLEDELVEVSSQGAYQWKDSDMTDGPAYVWNDISATGVLLVPSPSSGRNLDAVNLSFTFPFYGEAYTQLHVNASGFLTLGTPGASQLGGNYGQTLPTSTMPGRLIAGLAGKLNALAGGAVYALDTGAECIIQFENVPFHGTAGSVTFQIVLEQGGGIRFYYKTISGPVGSGVTVGIQDHSFQKGVTVAANQVYLKENLAVRIAQMHHWLKVAPLAGTSPAGQSTELAVTLDATPLAGGTYEGKISILNDLSGQATLEVPVKLVVDPVPTVEIVEPQDQAIFDGTVGIPLAAEATDDSNVIAKVQFYAGNTLIGEDAIAPYEMTWWPNLPAGDYPVVARAYDSSNGVGFSEPVLVHVTENSAPVIEVVSGDRQIGPVGENLPLPMVVRAVTKAGTPIPNAPLRFVVTGGDGEIVAGQELFNSYTTVSLGDGTSSIGFKPGETTLNRVTVGVMSSPPATAVLTAYASSGPSLPPAAPGGVGGPTNPVPTPGGGWNPLKDVDPPSADFQIIWIKTVSEESGLTPSHPDYDPSTVRIVWQCNIPNVTFNVQRKDSTGPWQTIGTTGDHYFVDAGLRAGPRYFYRVIATRPDLVSIVAYSESYRIYLIKAILGRLSDHGGERMQDESVASLIARVESSMPDYEDWMAVPLTTTLLAEGGGNIAPDLGFAGRSLAPGGGFYSVSKMQYKLSGYANGGEEFRWIEVFEAEEDPESPSSVQSRTSVKAIRTWKPSAGTVSESPVYEIDGRNLSTNGHCYLYAVPQISIIDEDEAIMDEWEEEELGVEVVEGEGQEFSMGDHSLPGIRFTISWQGTASLLVECRDYNASPSSWQPISSGTTLTPSMFGVSFRVRGTETSVHGDSIVVKVVVTAPDGTPIGEDQVKFWYSDARSLAMPVDEAAGARYRKIALNGRPLGDGKPQSVPEDDQQAEETFVDAMTLGLRHSATDVHMPLPGSELVLEARRSVQSEIWSMRQGLRPHERPDLPFGAGWASNLTPHIKLVTQVPAPYTTKSYEPDSVYVTDENGSVFKFLMFTEVLNQVQHVRFVPFATAKHERSTCPTTLEYEDSTHNVLVFRKKFGSVLRFEATGVVQSVPSDRIMGSPEYVTTSYYRLSNVTDRLGQKLEYEYSNYTTLVPLVISAPGRKGLNLFIRQNANGLVTSIWDANWNETKFFYETDGARNVQLLTKVRTPSGGETRYTYNLADEAELKPKPTGSTDPGVVHIHCDLASVRDPNDNLYQFDYVFPHDGNNLGPGKYDYERSGRDPATSGYFVTTGQPRMMRRVVLPDGVGQVWFANYSKSVIGRDPEGRLALTADSVKKTQVTDAEGQVRSYSWTDATVCDVTTIQDIIASGPPSHSVVAPKIVYYRTLTVDHAGHGTEVFEFDENAGLALVKTTDLSGNCTQFFYEDEWAAPQSYRDVITPEMGLNGVYNDVTRQTNARGKSKLFSYDTNRIMREIVDEEERRTVYAVDGLGRRTSESVYSGTNVLVQRTEFQYGDARFPGFVTQETVKKLAGDPASAQDLVTQYVPDGAGRVAMKRVDPAGLNLTTTHQYLANGSKLSSTDARGHATWFSYDRSNRLTRVTHPDASFRQLEYDSRGNKIREVNENGQDTLKIFDGLNRVVTSALDMNGNGVVDGPDIATTHAYNAVGSVTSTTDPQGNVTTFVYDGLQRLKEQHAPLNTDTLYQYGANSGGSVFDSTPFKPTRTEDPRGFVTAVTYDSLYRPIETRVGYGTGTAVTHADYDDVGNVVKVTDPLGKQTFTEYDALNRPEKVTFHDTTTQKSFYTSTGLKWKVEDELGRQTVTEHDGAGRAVKVTQPVVLNGISGQNNSPVVFTVYDAAGNVVAVINPLGRRTDFEYDLLNRKVLEELPEVWDAEAAAFVRPAIATEYDSVGNVTKSTNARGYATDMVYDEANRVVTVTAPLVTKPDNTTARPVTASTYDKNGNVLTVTDPNGNVTTNTYDDLNRLHTTTDAEGMVVTNEYDKVGNRTAVIDGKNQRTEFEYDGLNRNTVIRDALNRETAFIYNDVNKTARLDAMGQRTEYGYDDRHRLETVTYVGRTADNRTYDYDAAGNLLGVTEPGKAGKTDVAYTYDALNRPLSETSGGVTHQYRYDLAGNRMLVTYGGTGREIVSTYDALNRLATMTENGRTTSYAYNAVGAVSIRTLPNGDATTTLYDALNRATQIQGMTAASGLLYTQSMKHDLMGNVAQVSEIYPSGLANRTVVNTYDDVYRLVNESTTTTGSGTVSVTYGYDDANNRSQKIVTSGPAPGTTDYTYNSINQLTGWTDGTNTASYTYDLNGNRAIRTQGADSDALSWDYENRLVSFDKNTGDGQGLYTFVYDYRTRRVETVKDAAPETKFVFSGGTSVQELDGGVLSAELVRGSDIGGGVGGLLYSLRSGTPSYTHYNARGDVVAKTDGAGTLTYQAAYEAWGEIKAESGSTADRQKSNSKDRDVPGYANEGFRYRDLETGAFLSKDPAGFVDGPNVYAYVRQNPWTKFDPLGLAEGHHMVGQATFKDNPDPEVRKFLNSSEARLTSDAYEKLGLDPTHGGRKLNGLVPKEYNKAVSELSVQTFGARPNRINLEQAKQLVEMINEINNSDSGALTGSAKLICNYNNGVLAEIDVADKVAEQIDVHLDKAGSKSKFGDLAKNAAGELVDPETGVRFSTKFDSKSASTGLKIFTPKGKNPLMSFFVNNSGRIAQGAAVLGVSVGAISALDAIAEGEGYSATLDAAIRGDRVGVSQGLDLLGLDLSKNVGHIGPSMAREAMGVFTGY